MAWEIERRYLVRVRPDLWEELEQGTPLRQGYVRRGTPSVRVRFGESRGPVLTCKSGKGVRRREAETVVPEDVAEALWAAAAERTLAKVRYRLGPWELDRFQGDLDGLELLEIELDHEDDPVPDPPPGVTILHEVTHTKGFTSSHLASLSKKERRAFVQNAYGKYG